MDAVAFYPRFRLPSFSAGSKPKLGKPLFSLKEIADCPSSFASRNDFAQLTTLSIRAIGDRKGQPPQKLRATGRTPNRDENDISQSPDSKSSNAANQEEIIALFRRIQASISKGNSTSQKRSSSNSSQDKSSAESVLEVLRQSRKQVKGEITSKKEGNKALTRRRGLPQKVQEHPSVTDAKLIRPPSNFVKRSPIPSPSSPRKTKVVEHEIEASAAIPGEDIESQTLEEMKLSELKGLAKTRGIKGYSKLRKSELVELLKP